MSPLSPIGFAIAAGAASASVARAMLMMRVVMEVMARSVRAGGYRPRSIR